MKYETKIGLFAVIMIIASIFTINFLKGSNIFKKSNTIYSLYTELDGLNSSAAVYYRGYRIGTVKEIIFSNDIDKFVVKSEISRNINIPKDSYLEIHSFDIMGTKALRIISGSSSDFITSGDSLTSRIEINIVNTLFDEVMSTKKMADTLLTNLNGTIISINGILHKENIEHIESSLESVENSMEHIEYITENIRDISPEFIEIIQNLNILANNFLESYESINNGVNNIEEITQELKDAELQETLISLKSLVEKLQNPDGSIGKILHTDSLHNSVVNLTNDLCSLIEKIEENPKKFLRISVF